jgi:hypothetical protein
MSDQMIDSLREEMFGYIEQADKDIMPVIDSLAAKLSNFPDAATMAPDRAHYIIVLLQKLEALSIGSDPRLVGFNGTLTRLEEILRLRIYHPDPRWEEQ